MTFKHMIKEYVDALESPPNAWGVHLTSNGTPSHHYLDNIYDLYGQEKTNKVLQNILNRRQQQ